VYQKLPKIWLSFLAILTEKKKILQIDSKWSETRKKHETGETEFLPVAGAGSRRTTNFPCRQC
jgi:hypothetical protein